MRYVVAHVISSPLGAVRTARLVIADVPDKTRPAEVVEALSAAGLAAKYAEGGVPLGNHEVLAEGRAGWREVAGIEAARPASTIAELTKADDGPGARLVTWSRLTTAPVRKSDDQRRVTLRLSTGQHGAYSLAAARASLSLDAWCRSALDAAAAAQAPAQAPAGPTVPAVRSRVAAQAAAPSSDGSA